METNILPVGYQKIIKKLLKLQFIRNFYLSGGTALALQLGHRESIDFDFFSKDEVNPEEILKQLKTAFILKDVSISKGTLNCVVDGVKFQFLYYPYSLLEKFVNWEGINLSSVIDVACTKLITVSARGSKKDFIDIYFILKKYSLGKLFEKMDMKYKGIDFNKVHILKSLTSFEEADKQPVPKMHIPADWESMKKKISSETIKFLKEN